MDSPVTNQQGAATIKGRLVGRHTRKPLYSRLELAWAPNVILVRPREIIRIDVSPAGQRKEITHKAGLGTAHYFDAVRAPRPHVPFEYLERTVLRGIIRHMEDPVSIGLPLERIQLLRQEIGTVIGAHEDRHTRKLRNA